MTNPDQPIPPGETIRDELETRGWTQLELAQRTNLIPEIICSLIEGRWPIDRNIADRLANAFDGNEAFWLNLEANYRAALAKRKGGG